MTDQSRPVLMAEDVVTRFGAVVAVDEVSLQVGAGEVVGLIGANGAGKTSLIRTLLGLVRPAAGRVELPGGRPSRRTRQRIGYVPQGLGLWRDLTVLEHVELAAAVYGHRRQLDGGAFDEVADRRVGELPLGWRRRVAFMLALAHEPAAVLLDEPTSGVDPLARVRLWDVVRDTADRGAGVLVSTHHLDEAAQCDRVVLLAAGRIVAAGSAGELTSSRRSFAVRPHRWEDAWRALAAADVAALPHGAGLRVPDIGVATVEALLAGAGVTAEVVEVPATLEEVFLTASTVPRPPSGPGKPLGA